MSTKATLARGAAMGALIALAAGAAAEARPLKKHHRHMAAPAAAPAATRAELEALRAEIAELRGRLEGQAAATQQAQAQAVQAQAIATQSQAQTQAEISRIPAEVRQDVAAATPKPKTGWWDNTTVTGRMYYDLSMIDQKTNTGIPATSGKVAPSGVGFDLKRFYLGVDHKFSDVYSANLTLDEEWSSSGNNGKGSTSLFVKKAYLQAAYSPALTVRLGAADLPWIPFVEDVYGYRFVEQTLTDRTKFGTSTDWGVHAMGKLANGHVGYQLSVVNGAGYRNPGQPSQTAGNRSKQVDVEGRVNLNVNRFVFAVGGYDGKLGKNIQQPPGAPALSLHNATRFNALAAYVDPRFRVGLEYFTASNWSVTGADRADGWSGFGSFNLNPRIAVFGRYDYEKPNKTTAPSKKDGYFNVGVNFEPVKIVDLSLVYKRDKVEHGSLSTGNGTIGGAVDGTFDELGLFGQIRW